MKDLKRNEQVVETLLAAFEPDELGAIPESSFLVRAEYSHHFDQSWKPILKCEQSIAEKNLDLKRNGFEVSSRLESRDFSFGMCLLTRHKKENYGNLARGLDLLKSGGTYLLCGHNDIGVRSIEKNIAKHLTIDGKITENHCRAFWLTKPESLELPEEWVNYIDPGNHIPGEPFKTCPGIFSWDKIDRGSQFLLQHLSPQIKGKVADFGCGWGYLSHHLLENFPNITSLDLYENEKLALDCAKLNLPDSDKLNFSWKDLSATPPKTNHYDWIISNPPFHTSSRTDVGLGCKFIENAAKSLKRSGTLIIVANRQLPYEREFNDRFGEVVRIEESTDFKIIMGSKRFRADDDEKKPR